MDALTSACARARIHTHKLMYRVITNDVSDYIHLLVRTAHIICNYPTHINNVFSIPLYRDSMFQNAYRCKQKQV
jgi:hypothetical protein